MKRQGIPFHSAKAEEALRFFLSQAVLPDKRARYLDLISRPKSRKKFLDTFYHELEYHLDPARRVGSLSLAQLALPGYRFDHYDEALGVPEETMAAAATSMEESVLVISADGKIGIHTPESFIDGRTFYVL